MDLISLDPAILSKWNRAVPRYTSYPTAPQFHAIEEEVAIAHLKRFIAIWRADPACCKYWAWPSASA